jgi:hypothetical protein
MPTLTASAPGGQEVPGRRAGGDIAADDLEFGILALAPGHAIQHPLGVAMGGIHHDHIHPCGDQGRHPFIGAGADAHGGAHPQPLLVIAGGIGEVLGLLDVLDGDQAAQLEGVIDHQHLLDAVLVEQGQHLLAAGALAHRHQAVVPGHDVAHRDRRVGSRSADRAR